MQVSLLQAGRGAEVVQETRLWDEGRQETSSMRTKEGLADYRWGRLLLLLLCTALHCHAMPHLCACILLLSCRSCLEL